MGQENQILDMNKSLGKLSIHEGILDDIRSKKYYRRLTDDVDEEAYSKCNIFVDDILKKYYGVSLPKRRQFSQKWPSIKRNPDWPDNPGSASTQYHFFGDYSKLPESGITEVDPMTGSRLSAEGKPVVVFGGGHATLASPHTKWPQVYRSDLTSRRDERMEVGVKPGAKIKFFLINPEKYKKFIHKLPDRGYAP